MTGQHLAHTMELELERGHDAEVPAAAAHRPEQIAILDGVRMKDARISNDDFHPRDVVASEAQLWRERALAAAERISGDADRWARAERYRHRESIRHLIEFARQHPRLKPHRGASRIDRDALHQRQIDHEAAVAGPVTREAMASAANGDH